MSNSQLITLLTQNTPRLRYREISQELNLPLGTIGRSARILIKTGKIPDRNLPRYKAPTGEQMIRLRHIAKRRVVDEWTWGEIGDEEGTSRQAVQQITVVYSRQYKAYCKALRDEQRTSARAGS